MPDNPIWPPTSERDEHLAAWKAPELPTLDDCQAAVARLLEACDETDAEQHTDGSNQPAVITTRRIRELLSEGDHRAG